MEYDLLNNSSPCHSWIQKFQSRGERFLGSGDTFYTCTPLHVSYIFLVKEENKIVFVKK